MLIDDELDCFDVLNLTPIVLDESITDQSSKKNHDLSIDYFYCAVGLMSIYNVSGLTIGDIVGLLRR